MQVLFVDIVGWILLCVLGLYSCKFCWWVNLLGCRWSAILGDLCYLGCVCVCVWTIVRSIDKVAHNILLHAWFSKLWLNTLNWVLWILHDDVAYHDPTLLLQYYGGFGTNYIYFQMMKFSKKFFLKEQIFGKENEKSAGIFRIFFILKKLRFINYSGDVCWSCPCIMV